MRCGASQIISKYHNSPSHQFFVLVVYVRIGSKVEGDAMGHVAVAEKVAGGCTDRLRPCPIPQHFETEVVRAPYWCIITLTQPCLFLGFNYVETRSDCHLGYYG
jgi:hypothetical protein